MSALHTCTLQKALAPTLKDEAAKAAGEKWLTNSGCWLQFRREVQSARSKLKSNKPAVEVRELNRSLYQDTKVKCKAVGPQALKVRRTKEQKEQHEQDPDEGKAFREDVYCLKLVEVLKSSSNVEQFCVLPLIDRFHSHERNYRPVAQEELVRGAGEEMSRTLHTVVNIPEIIHFVKVAAEVPVATLDESSDEDVRMEGSDEEHNSGSQDKEGTTTVGVVKTSAFSSLYKPVVEEEEVHCRVYHGSMDWYKASVDHSDTQQISFVVVDGPRGACDEDYDALWAKPQDMVSVQLCVCMFCKLLFF